MLLSLTLTVLTSNDKRYPLGTSGLGSFCTVLGAALLTVLYTLGVQSTANSVIAHTRKVFYSTATDKHNTVLLKVVTFTTNVRGNLEAVSQTNTAHFTKC